MPNGPTTVVVDACCIITYGNVMRLDLVATLAGRRVVIAARAYAEVKKPPASVQVATEIATGRLSVEMINLADLAEATLLAHFDSRPAFRNRGEAEVLALATARGYAIASDEAPVLTAALNELGSGYVFTSATLLRQAVREGRITISDALTLLSQMDIAAGVQKAATARQMTIRDYLSL